VGLVSAGLSDRSIAANVFASNPGGDRDGAPLVVSGQAWGEENLIGRPAILDMPVGKGRVVAFNFNPLHRDINRGDQRLLWNAILNWQAIVSRR
jgi:hypothetical protein